jgi:hypothetical protein
MPSIVMRHKRRSAVNKLSPWMPAPNPSQHFESEIPAPAEFRRYSSDLPNPDPARRLFLPRQDRSSAPTWLSL